MSRGNKKICYICGRTIGEDEPYFALGYNSYVCSNDKCFEESKWDYFAAKGVTHQYAIVDGNIYLFSIVSFHGQGKKVSIKFADGYSHDGFLLYICAVPSERREQVPDNAIIF